MPSHLTAAVDDPDDFREALGPEETIGLLATRWDGFSAALTQVRLHGLRLLSIEENVPRIGIFAVPADKALILFLLDHRSSQIWGGAQMQGGELITVGPGQIVHARIDGPCHWGAIWSPVAEIRRYCRAVTGELSTVPHGVCHWTPSRGGGGRFRQLVASVLRLARHRPGSLVEAESAHGIEQQLIHGVIMCLAGEADRADSGDGRVCRRLMSDLEALLQAQDGKALRTSDIGAALGVTERVLRNCCAKCLGMNPAAYHRLRRMHLARRALRAGTPRPVNVSGVAERFGFHNPSRFTASYRALFGELPSRPLAGLSGNEIRRSRHERSARAPLIEPEPHAAVCGLLK